MNKTGAATRAATPTAHVLIGRLLATADRFRSRLEGALAMADLSMAKVSVLQILSDAGEPMALSELAEHNRCVRSNITQLVDRLEKDGFVRRIMDPADRRIRRAELTAAGRKAHAAGARIIAAEEHELMKDLSASERIALEAATNSLHGCGR
jgi:DNA-binding MarR family transcriptional regulator